MLKKLTTPFTKSTKDAKDTSPDTPASPTSTTSSKKPDKAEMRRKVLKEILDTERSYIESLRTVVDLYMRPLSENGIMSPADYSVVFSNINTLFTLNQRFLSDLQVHMQYADSKQRIGGLFLEFAPFFKMYSHYVQNHENASRVNLELYQNTKKFRNFCDEVASNERCKGLNLASYLIMPIQRIPRYKLLGESLLKETPTTYDDYPDLARAAELLSVVATHINEEVRRQENRNMIRQIQKQFSENPMFLQPGRLFIKQGELLKRDRSEQGTKGKALHFILFNNAFAFAQKKRSGGLKLIANIAIDSAFNATWLDAHVDKVGDKVSEKAKDLIPEHSFVVTSSSQAFICTAASREEAKDWLDSITQCIKDQKDADTFEIKKSSALEAKGLWQDADLVQSCMVCEIQFTLFRRKHHCRQCGNVVCDGCTTKKELKSDTGDKSAKSEPLRVCSTCYELLLSLEESLTAGAPEVSKTGRPSTTKLGDGKDTSGKGDLSQVKILRQPLVSIKSWTRDGGSTQYLIEIGSPDWKGKPIGKKYQDFYEFDVALKKKHAKLKTTHSLQIKDDVKAEKKKEPSKTDLTTTTTGSTSELDIEEEDYGEAVPNIPPQKKRFFGAYRPEPEQLERRRVMFQLWLRHLFRAFRSDPVLRKDVADWLGVDVACLTSRKEDSACSIM